MRTFAYLITTSVLLLAAANSQALQSKRTPFTGIDISGVYACVGNDVHDGDSTSTMTLTLDKKYSSGKSGAFKAVEAAGPVTYNGSVVSNGKQLALDFANTDLSKKDFGVALATLETVSKGKYKIRKFYYEPEYMSGGNGFEDCTMK